MTLDTMLAELADRGHTLDYLKQGTHAPKWEARVHMPLAPAQRVNGYLLASGYGRGHTAASAIASAIEALARDPQLVEPFQPAANLPDLRSTTALNLAEVMAIITAPALSKPAAPIFKRTKLS
jgi:hypothetical protein